MASSSFEVPTILIHDEYGEVSYAPESGTSYDASQASDYGFEEPFDPSMWDLTGGSNSLQVQLREAPFHSQVPASQISDSSPDMSAKEFSENFWLMQTARDTPSAPQQVQPEGLSASQGPQIQTIQGSRAYSPSSSMYGNASPSAYPSMGPGLLSSYPNEYVPSPFSGMPPLQEDRSHERDMSRQGRPATHGHYDRDFTEGQQYRHHRPQSCKGRQEGHRAGRSSGRWSRNNEGEVGPDMRYVSGTARDDGGGPSRWLDTIPEGQLPYQTGEDESYDDRNVFYQS